MKFSPDSSVPIYILCKKLNNPLFLLLLLSFVAHAPFVLRGFGEQDAARLANVAIFFAKGHIPVATFIWSSPAYIFLLEKCLTVFKMPAYSLPAVMNWANVIFGTLIVIPLFLFSNKILSKNLSIFCILIFILTPTFWLSCLYGMPHVISFFFFMLSLCFFYRLTWVGGWPICFLKRSQ